ncbi:lipoprotein [Zoogloea sp.]|jgi:predicted small lipoprotein YifL|uniref:LPS translocon maturation chaperone LptM n=1 Tax=Zoogloea sp. TaxID=49181 RepID=UPI001B55D94B|nr:lipoprotein [Zoogloea sp.]MBK6655911.1 lipoprotein [Zoogloea sp.]MBP7445035.1 lipoprotein [Zoogloea sp.]HOY01697.1 lipoprotein [Zoogloea sp.]HPI60442.1 lipoprotein [Zoogloea sp.]
MRTFAIAAAACGSLLLTACGIKGPLHYPQIPKPAAKAATPADTTPTPNRAPGVDHNKPVSQDPAQ